MVRISASPEYLPSYFEGKIQVLGKVPAFCGKSLVTEDRYQLYSSMHVGLEMDDQMSRRVGVCKLGSAVTVTTIESAEMEVGSFRYGFAGCILKLYSRGLKSKPSCS